MDEAGKGLTKFMEQLIYLDNAATTKVCEEAAEAALRAMREGYGNPSSLHGLGAAAAKALAASREEVAALLGCDGESVCFTSGGSESNNLAILGGAQARRRQGKHLVITQAEHSSVSGAAGYLEKEGWEVTRIAPGADGQVDAAAFAAAVRDDTALVSMMMVNNETGAVFPVLQAAKLIRTAHPKTLIHCDAVQAFGKLPLKLGRSEVDLASVSGHKIGAPKGSGALYIRRGVRIIPLIHGGGQERGIRSGTESIPMIAALGAAAGWVRPRLSACYDRTQILRGAFLGKLRELPELCINSPEDGSPYIMNVSVPGYRSETMLHFLESRGIYVSSGSACSKGAVSPVLTAMGLSKPRIDSALRVSLIYDTPDSAPQMLADALREGISCIAHR